MNHEIYLSNSALIKNSPKNRLVSPFVKWVGGKRQLLPDIIKHLPKNFNKLHYFEPFVGGGAVLFHIQPKSAYINDFNSELINVYKVVKNNVSDLIADLRKHENTQDYFYKLRGLDRSADYKNLTEVQRASRIIYLNKTCFNGLYRVNNAGEFNSPFGRYKNPNIVNEPTLKAVSKYLNTNDIKMFNSDYKEVLEFTDINSFVYIDPPYHPISESSNFTGYIKGGWSEIDQERLKSECDELNKKGVKFLLSNSACEFILQLYKDYNLVKVKANRNINSVGDKRGEVDEVLISNYDSFEK